MSWQLVSFALLAAVLVGGFTWYERSRPPSQIVALVAALAALAVAGRVVLAAIPNVVATTDIVIFSGYALGGAPGFAVGALAGLISNFWLGQGPWTPWQMAAWGLCGVLGALLARATGRRAGRLQLTLACGLSGIAFGALLNFSLMVSYGGDFTLQRWLTLEARAVPFDLAHAIGNITLALVAGPAMVRMLIRFRERFEFRWQAPDKRRPGAGLAGAASAVLLALLVTVAVAPRQVVASPSTVGWLKSAQSSDGGWPAAQGEDSDPQMTGWTMLGLEAAGVNPLDLGGRRGAAAYLRGNLADVRTPGDLARTILALDGAGVDASRFGGQDLVSRLAGRRRPDGSYQGWPNSTAFAVMALRASGRGGGSSASLAWLRRVQAKDGGWGAVPGAASDPDSTGAVLQALGSGSRSARRAVRFLRRTQQRNGGWPLVVGGSSNSQSTAWAVQGLLAAGVSPSSVKNHGRSGLDYLAAQRASDGHYRYSSSSDQTPVWVTGQVLVAAEGMTYPLAPVPRAVRPSVGEAGAPKATAGASGGSGGGGAAAPSERFAPERAKPPAAKAGDANRASGERGRGPAPSQTPAIAPSRPRRLTNTAFSGDDGGSGGSSPLVPIAIAIGAAGAVLGGTWWAARRFVW